MKNRLLDPASTEPTKMGSTLLQIKAALEMLQEISVEKKLAAEEMRSFVEIKGEQLNRDALDYGEFASSILMLLMFRVHLYKREVIQENF